MGNAVLMESPKEWQCLVSKQAKEFLGGCNAQTTRITFQLKQRKPSSHGSNLIVSRYHLNQNISVNTVTCKGCGNAPERARHFLCNSPGLNWVIISARWKSSKKRCLIYCRLLQVVNGYKNPIRATIIYCNLFHEMLHLIPSRWYVMFGCYRSTQIFKTSTMQTFNVLFTTRITINSNRPP